MWFKKYEQDAYDQGYWDGQQDNPYQLSTKHYHAGYLAGQKTVARREVFAGSELCYQAPLIEPLAN